MKALQQSFLTWGWGGELKFLKKELEALSSNTKNNKVSLNWIISGRLVMTVSVDPYINSVSLIWRGG